MRRRLPIFVERSLQQVQADRIELTDAFERTIVGDKAVSCKAGCSACCHHPLFITILEAIPLYGSLVARGQWVPSLKEKLQKVSSLTSGLDTHVWLRSNIACPLLKDNRCMAYESRPFACRATIATGDPYYCAPQRLGAHTTIAPRVEAMKEFHAREKAILRKHGLLHLVMPLGRAVLLAERVCSGALTLEDVDRTYVADHLADEA